MEEGENSVRKLISIAIASAFFFMSMPAISFDGGQPAASFETAAYAKSKKVKVKSYTKKNGTRVKSHTRKSPKRR